MLLASPTPSTMPWEARLRDTIDTCSHRATQQDPVPAGAGLAATDSVTRTQVGPGRSATDPMRVVPPGQPAGAPTVPGVPAAGGAVQVSASCIRIHGQPKLLRVGSVQWFRLPECDWDDLLDRFMAAGLNTIDMYVPWRDIEPKQGEFDAAKLDAMCRFLDLAKHRGLYVYFRPGPYICDELDGGGIPSWIRAQARERDDDGCDDKVIMRTDCPNWLRHVERYFEKVNERIEPYLASHDNGPIILYAVENEYDHFERVFRLEKLFVHQGRAERRWRQSPGTSAYLSRLRDIVRRRVDVPIATCPGMPKVAGLQDTPDIWPLPNHWPPDGHEANAAALLADMHDATRHGGIYNELPGGISEGPALATSEKRQIMAGLKVAAAFNAVGSHQDGYRNTIDLDPKTIGFPMAGMSHLSADASPLSRANRRRLFLHPKVGYMSGVLDFYGPISHSGSLRAKFYSFRRANMLFDTYEERLARATPGQSRRRSLWRRSDTLCRNDDVVRIGHARLGARRGRFGRQHNWLDAGDGGLFVSVLNPTGQPQRLGCGSVELLGDKVPCYTELVVPTEDYPGSDADHEQLSYNMILPARLPLGPHARLRYSTAEVLTERQLRDRKLLVVYGEPGTSGELVLDQLTGPVEILSKDAGIEVHQNEGGQLAVSFGYEPGRFITVRTEQGETLQIMITTRALAGRTWFLGEGTDAVVLSGLDYVDEVGARRSGAQMQLDFEHDAEASSVEVTTLSSQPHSLDGFEVVTPYDPVTAVTRFRKRLPGKLPHIPRDLLVGGTLTADTAEAQPDYDDSGWQSWTGQPRALDDVGIHEGHAWYRTEVDLDKQAIDRIGRTGGLHVDHADDFVGLYINGRYVSTLAPLGNAIDTSSREPRVGIGDIRPYLREGRNVIALRTEIWGHGAFESPQGRLKGTNVSLPAISAQSKKGLRGEARLGPIPLTQWRVRPQLGGEAAGLKLSNGECATARRPSPARPGEAAKVQLEPGAVVWYEKRFRTDALPDVTSYNAPVMLRLKGVDACATVFLNGEPVPIGRWLSDDGWLHRGTWANASREMWSYANPDHIPLPLRQLRSPPEENVLQIVFKDSSDSSDGRGGHIDEIALVLNDDELAKGDDEGVTVRVPTASIRGRTVLRQTR